MADVLRHIPVEAKRVGLVGAAVGHHRELRDLMSQLIESGRGVSLSSLRADRLDEELVELLARGGTKTMTVAADGASARLREAINKRVEREELLRAVELGRECGLRAVKLYAMVGLPDERESDLRELCDLALEMSRVLPLSMAVSPFVPKARTSLAGAPFAGISLIRRHLSYIRKNLKGRVELRSSSVREAWIENTVARGGYRAGVAAVEIAQTRREGHFAAWKSAAEKHDLLLGETRDQ